MVKLINTRTNSDKVRSKESQTSLNLIQESGNETQTVKTTNVTKVEAKISGSLPVHIWIDIPNDFPWRNCLQEYNRALTPLHCNQETVSQQFVMEPVSSPPPVSENDSVQMFKWKTTQGGYIIPGKTLHEDVLKETLVLNDTSDGGFWTWTAEGQVRWSQGCKKCVTSLKANQPIALTFCKPLAEDQNIEIGRYEEGQLLSRVLRPLDVEKWRIRQDKMRNEFLVENKATVMKALAEIDEDDLIHVGGFKGEERRAAVFYVDKGKGAIANVNWWIYSWKFIGLNVAKEAFDLVMMVHPAAIQNLPPECKEVTEGFHPNFGQAGECLYKPYIGITYRDKSYDRYMNSQECLFGPGSEFLSEYKVLLRADLDHTIYINS